jgi:hypothetical protein
MKTETAKLKINETDLLKITIQWDETNARRCQLIGMKYHPFGLTKKEKVELSELQRLAGLKREMVLTQGDKNV